MSALSLVDTPVPGVPEDAQLAAKKAYNNALIKLNNQRQGVLRNYGYTANFDPSTGQMSGLNVDSSNPYGQLQLTLRQQALEDDSAKNNAIGRGLHGGLANQAETDLQFSHHGQTSQLASGLMGQMDSFAGQQQDARTQYDNTLYQAQLEASRNAILQQLFSTPDYGPNGDDGGGGGNDGGNDNWMPPVTGTGRSTPGAGGGLGGSYTPANKLKVVKKVIAKGKKGVMA